MDFLVILLVGAATFGLCFLLDKGFTGIFRSKPQHQTGLSVRVSQHYGGAGLLLVILGVAAIFKGLNEGKVLLIAGAIVALLGVGLIVYYMSFGVYYDGSSFILTTFGRKSKTYSYRQIQGQKLYSVTGGNVVIELFFDDGRTLALQSNMKGAYPFLDTAFAKWCEQTGKLPEDCLFHDPQNSCWFPSMEE